MNIALRKVELIEWLARLQDEKLIQQVEALRKGSAKEVYDARMPSTLEELERKLEKSQQDIDSGRVHMQERVEEFFKSKFVE